MNRGIHTRLAVAAALAATLAACGGGDSRNRVAIRNNKAPAEPGAGQAAAVKPYPPPQAGTITGTVKWDGAIPAIDYIDVSANAECVRNAKEKIYQEKLVVNPNSTVRFCLVSIDTNDVYAPPSEAVLVDQVGCHYTPHVFAVMAGQPLTIRSSDAGTQHNVHYVGTVDTSLEDNFSMSASTKQRTFTSPDWIMFKCDVHPWMKAWCSVKSHPFFAVTGEDGTFTIKNAPAGKQKLVVHHENPKLGDQTIEVTVEAGKTVTQDFTYKAK
jgi:plastocyanin